MAEPHSPAEVPGWHHVPLPCAGMGLAEPSVLQAEWYSGFVTGFKHTSRDENALRFLKENCCKKHDTRAEGRGEGSVLYHSVFTHEIRLLPFFP